MAISREIRKKVNSDWQNAFPELSLFAQDKLYKIVGPFVIGLELIKLPRLDEYRPHFAMYPLWRSDIKECLSIPIIIKEYYDRRGFQFSIPYDKHDGFFREVLDCVEKQTLLAFVGEISIRKVISKLDDYSKGPPLNASPNSYLQAAIQEAKLRIALYIDLAGAQSIFGQIVKRKWDIHHFKACGVDVDKWLHSLQIAVSNRNDFLKQLENNLSDIRLSSIKRSVLIE